MDAEDKGALTMAHHAKQGGEIGANGSFYKGGQFVNDSGVEEKRAARERAKILSRKQEVAPYVWECPPSVDAQSAFKVAAGVCPFDRRANTFGPVPDGYAAYIGPEGAARIDAARVAYNAGVRWLVP